MKITAVQPALVLGDVEQNYELIEAQIRRAAAQKADCIVLPELWNTSFYPSDVRDLADVDGARTKSFLSDLALSLGVHIIGGSVANWRNGKLYNTTFVVNRSGTVAGVYDKVHLFTPGGEDKAFTAGDHLNVFSLDGITMATVICYDVRFAEWTRMAALAGAQVLVVPAAWPDIRIDHWQILNRARAIENQLFVVAVNSCGTAGDMVFGGHSLLIDPWGKVLAEGGPSAEQITADIDVAVVETIRRNIPVFHDRRPELYTLSD